MMKIRYLKPAMLGETLSDVVAATAVTPSSVSEPRGGKPTVRRPARAGSGARLSKQPHAAEMAK